MARLLKLKWQLCAQSCQTYLPQRTWIWKQVTFNNTKLNGAIDFRQLYVQKKKSFVVCAIYQRPLKAQNTHKTIKRTTNFIVDRSILFCFVFLIHFLKLTGKCMRWSGYLLIFIFWFHSANLEILQMNSNTQSGWSLFHHTSETSCILPNDNASVHDCKVIFFLGYHLLSVHDLKNFVYTNIKQEYCIAHWNTRFAQMLIATHISANHV